MGVVLDDARVTTGDQDPGGRRLRLPAAGLLRPLGDVRSDRGMDRERLPALLEAARPGDTPSTVRLDWPGRSLNGLPAIVDELKGGGALLSLAKQIGTGSAAGELVAHVVRATGPVERPLVSERIRDGMASAHAGGRRPMDRDGASCALRLVEAGVLPKDTARRVGLGRAAGFREMAGVGTRRSA